MKVASMKVGVGSQDLSYKFIKIICFFLFIFAGATSSVHVKCPFQFLYHFGAAVTDIGNSRILEPTVPAAHPPYGITYPGRPTGRWSDGRIDFDFLAADLGQPFIVPYLSIVNDDVSELLHDGVVFSVARSPVLDREFFDSRNIKIEDYAVPLSRQLDWFSSYVESDCPEGKVCANRLGKALVLFGDMEGNDIGYSLVQGKTIQEVETYVPYIIIAQFHAARDVIKMGATRLVIPGNGPLGCYPYILTALSTDNSTEYDHLGCLKRVNDLIVTKNKILQLAIKELEREFPNVNIYYSDFYEGARRIIQEKNLIGVETPGLKACCGVGGKYNYNPERFCGKTGVPYCKHPEEYVFWDGLFFTEDTYERLEKLLLQPALVALNCTPAN